MTVFKFLQDLAVKMLIFAKVLSNVIIWPRLEFSCCVCVWREALWTLHSLRSVFLCAVLESKPHEISFSFFLLKLFTGPSKHAWLYFVIVGLLNGETERQTPTGCCYISQWASKEMSVSSTQRPGQAELLLNLLTQILYCSILPYIAPATELRSVLGEREEAGTNVFPKKLISKDILCFLLSTEVSCRKTTQELEGLQCCDQGHLIRTDFCQLKLELSRESGKTKEEFEHF